MAGRAKAEKIQSLAECREERLRVTVPIERAQGAEKSRVDRRGCYLRTREGIESGGSCIQSTNKLINLQYYKLSSITTYFGQEPGVSVKF